MERPDQSQMIKQAGFIESALSDEVHRPQRTGLENGAQEMAAQFFISWVKSRASGIMRHRDRLKSSGDLSIG
jgi:hypothetical protein